MTNEKAPELCYVLIRGAKPGKRIGIIKRGESGYYLTDFDSAEASDDVARDCVKHFNKKLGVSPAHAEAMEIGSMFGWHVPGARPEFCD
jgi:hypothetical protein